jgi:hypothetical protein
MEKIPKMVGPLHRRVPDGTALLSMRLTGTQNFWVDLSDGVGVWS